MLVIKGAKMTNKKKVRLFFVLLLAICFSSYPEVGNTKSFLHYVWKPTSLSSPECTDRKRLVSLHRFKLDNRERSPPYRIISSTTREERTSRKADIFYQDTKDSNSESDENVRL